jgi:hypothetical protein
MVADLSRGSISISSAARSARSGRWWLARCPAPAHGRPASTRLAKPTPKTRTVNRHSACRGRRTTAPSRRPRPFTPPAPRSAGLVALVMASPSSLAERPQPLRRIPFLHSSALAGPAAAQSTVPFARSEPRARRTWPRRSGGDRSRQTLLAMGTAPPLISSNGQPSPPPARHRRQTRRSAWRMRTSESLPAFVFIRRTQEEREICA